MHPDACKYFEFITMLFHSETFEVDHEHTQYTEVSTSIIHYIETVVCPDFFHDTNRSKNTLLLRQEIISEVVKNILDAHATQFTIQCTSHAKGMCIKFIDNGDGIHAARTDEKHGNNHYYGGAGISENLLKTALVLSDENGLIDEKDEHGSRTTILLP